MVNQQLSLQQLEQLKQISDPVARRRYMVLFQLPQDLQTSFESDVTTNSVWNITKEKYGLADTGVSAVARIIGLIFLGELNIKNFIAALRDELKIDVQKAAAIAQDINAAIFQPVRESLMQVHNIPRMNADQNADLRGNNNFNADNQPRETPNPQTDPNTRIYPNDANRQVSSYRPQAPPSTSLGASPTSPRLRGAGKFCPYGTSPAGRQVPRPAVRDAGRVQCTTQKCGGFKEYQAKEV